MSTWKELEAQGVARCCASLRSRTTGRSYRCRRRAVDGSWCSRHKGTMDSAKEWGARLLDESERTET